MTILPYTGGQWMPSAPIIFYLLSVILTLWFFSAIMVFKFLTTKCVISSPNTNHASSLKSDREGEASPEDRVKKDWIIDWNKNNSPSISHNLLEITTVSHSSLQKQSPVAASKTVA